MALMAKRNIQFAVEPAVYAAWEAIAHKHGKNLGDFIIEATQKAIQDAALKDVPYSLVVNENFAVDAETGKLTASDAKITGAIESIPGVIEGWQTNPEQAETAWQNEELAKPKATVLSGRAKKF